ERRDAGLVSLLHGISSPPSKLCLRSRPALKARPLPVTTMTLTSGLSASSRIPACHSVRILAVIAFIASGRLNVAVPTPLVTDSSMDMGLLWANLLCGGLCCGVVCLGSCLEAGLRCFRLALAQGTQRVFVAAG